ncbi:hypothetical protein LQR31_23390 [Chromobacterium vaccinii]|uniref:hypothetical protein n=1 Tax=Chromobacterium vaccinii TaxID=1108595 RepID=UPI001E498BD9|nr:hypothetical protein [Chromobacterium vaccinii]MCD4487420.1 hypothetical protein [Chromobacterium vaccinii]
MTISAATQGVAMATGMQKSFSWTSVAASGVAAWATSGIKPDVETDPFANIGYGTMRGMASGAIQSVLGNDHQPNWSSLAANSFGSALGDQVAGSLQAAEQQRLSKAGREVNAIQGMYANTQKAMLNSLMGFGSAPSAMSVGADDAFGYSLDEGGVGAGSRSRAGLARAQRAQAGKAAGDRLVLSASDDPYAVLPTVVVTVQGDSMRELSSWESFFTFNSLGKFMKGFGEAALGTAREIDAILEDGANRGQAVLADWLSIRGNEAPAARSGFFQSVDERGWDTTLAYTGWDMASGPVNSLAGVARAAYLHDEKALGAHAFGFSAAFALDGMARGVPKVATGEIGVGLASEVRGGSDLLSAPDYVNLVSKFTKMPEAEVKAFYSGMENVGVNYQELVGNAMSKYGMTPDEAHAVFGYTTKLFYRDLNKALGVGGSADASALSGLINNGLDKMPKAASVQYRGWRLEDSAQLGRFDEGYRLGKTVTSNFWSTAPSPADAYLATRNAVIYTNSARDISDLAFGVHFHNLIGKPVYSSETIIPPGVKFTVTGIDSSGRLILEQE